MPPGYLPERLRKAGKGLLLGIFLCVVPVPLWALHPFSSLFYYVEEPAAFTSALTHLNRISIIAPQVFVMDRAVLSSERSTPSFCERHAGIGSQSCPWC